ncbi:competence protein ComA [Rubrivirga sp. SAORIC476]|uniref:hotdog fold thioesterase n=1 Tax=Rubrivirga sp. SAORIC476 TaxID=1961794 RepID=UPI000BA93E19|nr:hotdog fold thioesterase [Rubrivirga sp. SAORIC476]PAP79358.1 competence protein ComA [Rubrivirga sp. SAORIC476]
MPKSLSDFPVRETLGDTLGMEIVEGSAERVVATMPVEPRHHQPLGYLHGGATVALAETVASVGAYLAAPDGYTAFGQEINANHLRPMREGLLTATGTPIHVGRTSQVWGVEVRDQAGHMICVSRCTLAVVAIRRESS